MLMLQFEKWWHVYNRTFEIGEVLNPQKLVRTTYEAMMKSIKIIKEGIHLGDIGSVIQNHVEAEGFSVVRDFAVMGLAKT